MKDSQELERLAAKPSSPPRAITSQRVFFPLAWFFGLLLVFAIPPFQVPDEYLHFYRSYQVSEGRLTAYRVGGEIGGYLPSSLAKLGDDLPTGTVFKTGHEPKYSVGMIRNAAGIALKSNDRTFYVFGAVSWHAPMNYLAQAVGIAVGRALGLNPLGLLYAGRIANLLVWSILIRLALRIIPIMDWTLFLLAMMPMSLGQACSLSADATVNGICFLFVAIVLRYALGTESKLTAGQLIVLTIAGAAVALAKTAYFPLTLLCLLVPQNKFNSSRRYWGWVVLFMLICAAVIVGWSLCTYGLNSYTTPGVSPKEQVIYMLHHPLLMLHIEVGMLGSINFLSAIVGRLGWYDVPLYLPCAIAYGVALFLTTQLGGRSDANLTIRQRIVLATAAAGCWLAAFSLIYLTFTQVGDRSITGIQGRYLIPATLPFFLIFYNRPAKPARWAGPLVAGFSAAFCVYTVLLLVCRFFIW